MTFDRNAITDTYYLSYGRWGKIKKSDFKFLFEYVNKFYGETTSALSQWSNFGGMVHDILEITLGQPKSKQEDLMEKAVENKIRKMTPADKDLFSRRLENTLPALISICEKYEIIALEEPLELIYKSFPPDSPLARKLMAITPFNKKPDEFLHLGFHGYMDAYVIDTDGKRCILDWKTGKFSEDKLEGYRQQTQVYTHAKRLKGDLVESSKIVYIESKAMEKEVDVGPRTCKALYEEMFEDFITRVDSICNGDLLKSCCGGAWFCNFSSICASLKGQLPIDQDFIDLIIG